MARLSAEAARPAPGGAWRGMAALAKAHLRRQLAYRDELVTRLLQMGVEVVIFRGLWIALYRGREVVAGATLEQALTYALANVIVAQLFSSWLIIDANDRIRSGDIIIDLGRPLGLGRQLFSRAVGEALSTLLTVSLPLALGVQLIYGLALPGSPAVWGIAGLSLALGFVTSFLMDYLIVLAGFWVTEVGGFYWSKGSILAILGGTYLPLWIYPPGLARVLEWLPFRGISYTPLAIFVGRIGLEQAPGALALQLAWVLILLAVAGWVQAAALRKLAVQGG